MTANRIRIASNYLRLLVTFASGLLIVRLLAEIGASALNIYLIVISGTGFAFFMKIVMQESVVPLLGLSFEDRSFARTYWISFLFAAFASLFACTIFLVLWLLRDKFDTGNLPDTTFALALASGALRTVFSSLATPPTQALLVVGRVVAYNVILASERLADLVAVVGLLVVAGDAGDVKLANAFFVTSAALYILVQVAAFAVARAADARFGFRPVRIGARDLRWTRRIFGWNIAIVVAFLLYLRFSTLAVNVAFGEGPTLVLGLVFLLIGYQRQISMGLVIGLDAAIARLYGAGKPGPNAEIRAIVLRSTYVQSVFSFGSVTILWVLADPLFRYWLGDSLRGSGWNVETAATLFRIMSLGVLARSLSENWMKILNGQGRVGTYAPWLLAGGVVYGVFVLIGINLNTSADTVLLILAVVFSTLYVLNHVVVVPWRLVSEMGVHAKEVGLAALLPGGVLALGLMTLSVILDPTQSLFAAVAWVAFGSLGGLALLHPTATRRFINPDEMNLARQPR
ncbi:MATE family efflux transporter [Maritimibacter dapengensis]|uniref:Membrane protein involved in the export of O-antigen and teichoic acid n=1 Tax=Maritimibacter dapengensis TaxID=2836868 RepID=A0ABS6T4J6_9RHOB|nr:MATE family efflux transporter [Maritimibacter dapengensis]MBV7380166.1 hypothetical protein [Maritimibacter dapengensis]